MANIKGFAVKGLLAYVNEKKPGAAREVVASLPPDVATAFDHPVVSSEMYPYRVFIELLRAVDRTIGRGDLSVCEDLGQFGARADFAGMFKSISGVLDAKTIYNRAPIFWSRYCDTGRSTVMSVNANDAVTRIEGFPDMDPAHCRLMTGWIRGWALLTYAQSIEADHAVCVSRGGPFCEWRMKWQ